MTLTPAIFSLATTEDMGMSNLLPIFGNSLAAFGVMVGTLKMLLR